MLEFTGKGLFVFSDPGGAKPILALIKANKNTLSNFLIISDRNYNFYQEFELKVEKFEEPVAYYFQNFRPSFVYTGTSYTSTIELQFLLYAQKNQIKSFSFVDHWTNIRKRFYLKNLEKEVFPTIINVIDDRAKQIAINEGINENIVQIVGNPYYKYLKNFQPTISKQELFGQLGLESNEQRNIILFAPDPLSNVNGIEQYGFDELTASLEINKITEDSQYLLIVNPHPNQKIENIKSCFNSNVIFSNASISVNHLIFYSNIILGFFSSFLIEASIMKKKVIRYLPYNANNNDPIEELEIGELAVTSVQLKQILNKYAQL